MVHIYFLNNAFNVRCFIIYAYAVYLAGSLVLFAVYQRRLEQSEALSGHLLSQLHVHRDRVLVDALLELAVEAAAAAVAVAVEGVLTKIKRKAPDYTLFNYIDTLLISI
jgi:hypothetical protein